MKYLLLVFLLFFSCFNVDQEEIKKVIIDEELTNDVEIPVDQTEDVFYNLSGTMLCDNIGLPNIEVGIYHYANYYTAITDQSGDYFIENIIPQNYGLVINELGYEFNPNNYEFDITCDCTLDIIATELVCDSIEIFQNTSIEDFCIQWQGDYLKSSSYGGDDNCYEIVVPAYKEFDITVENKALSFLDFGIFVILHPCDYTCSQTIYYMDDNWNELSEFLTVQNYLAEEQIYYIVIDTCDETEAGVYTLTVSNFRNL